MPFHTRDLSIQRILVPPELLEPIPHGYDGQLYNSIEKFLTIFFLDAELIPLLSEENCLY